MALDDEVTRANAAIDQYMSVMRDLVVPPVVAAERIVRQQGGSEALALNFAMLFAEMVVLPPVVGVNPKLKDDDDAD